MNQPDPLQSARDLIERGDLEGAERLLAAIAINGEAVHADRAVRALIVVCEQRGEVGLRAQHALEAWLARPAPTGEDAMMRPRAQRLFFDLGIDGAPAGVLSAALPDLPPLEGFKRKSAADLTQALPRSLTAVRSELEMWETPPAEEVPTTKLDAVDGASAGREPAPPPARTGGPPEIGHAFEVGAVVKERYEIRGPLGKGGHATVVRVFDRELEEECALKIFHPSGAAVDVSRFKREVSLSRRIVHENVITLYDIGQEHGFYFLTMELLTGSDLSTLLRARPIGFHEALGWLIEACRGIAAAHAKGIVHRDVKPANLFVQTTGSLKVMDFGIAKFTDSTSLTSTGTLVGTPQFVSPEQVRGEEVGVGADVYALGVVAYLLLTGTLPFRDKEMVALLLKHASAIPEAPRVRNPHLPVALDRLIMACLEKHPARRPHSCTELADALLAIKNQGTAATSPTTN